MITNFLQESRAAPTMSRDVKKPGRTTYFKAAPAYSGAHHSARPGGPMGFAQPQPNPTRSIISHIGNVHLSGGNFERGNMTGGAPR